MDIVLVFLMVYHTIPVEEEGPGFVYIFLVDRQCLSLIFDQCNKAFQEKTNNTVFNVFFVVFVF